MKKTFVRGLGLIVSGITLLALAAPGASVASAQTGAASAGALYASIPRVSGLVSSQVASSRDAMNAALPYIQKRYPVNTPPGVTAPWMAGGIMQTGDEAWTAYTYNDWLVKISYPSVPATIYRVVVTNDPLGFAWVGEVTSAGRVTTVMAQDPVGAWNAAYNYVRRNNRGALPSPSTPWQVFKVTQPPGYVGGAAIRLTSGHWVAEVMYAVALPPGHSTSYTVNMYNQTTGFNWTGDVDTNRRVTPRSAGR